MNAKVHWDRDLKDSNRRINQIMTFVKNVLEQKTKSYSFNSPMMLMKT